MSDRPHRARPVLGSAAPPGVEAIRRNGRRGSYLFLLNHGDTPVVATGSGTELLSGPTCASGLTIAEGGAAVIREAGTTQVVVR